MLGGNVKDRAERPTTTLYFSSCMDDLIGEMGDNRFPVWRLTPDAFFVPGETSKLLVLRQLHADLFDKIKALAPDEIHYLIDDDLLGGSRDRTLPKAYRSRLARMAAGPLNQMLSITSRLYVASTTLLETFDDYDPVLVHPHLVEPVSDLTHHDTAQTTKIIFSGSRSHLADFEAIKGDLKSFLRDRKDVQLDIFLGRHVRDFRLPNINNFGSLTWEAFRMHMASSRYHIALLPSQKTDFNSARSVSKLLEFACYGAAPILSETVPFAGLAQGAAIFCDNKPGSWLDALESAHINRTQLKEVAAKNVKLATGLGDPKRAKQFWINQLAIRS